MKLDNFILIVFYDNSVFKSLMNILNARYIIHAKLAKTLNYRKKPKYKQG